MGNLHNQRRKEARRSIHPRWCRLGFSVLVTLPVALALAIADPVGASVPQVKFRDCNAVWKKYATGLVPSRTFADLASRQGWKRPRINGRDFFSNYGMAQDGGGSGGVPYVICPVPPAPAIPAAPRIISASATSSGVGISMMWMTQSTPFKTDVYDVYLNGSKVAEGLTSGYYSFSNLAVATAYTVGVVARNSAGSSPESTAQVTTISQEQANNPGKVKVTYTASGTVDVTLQAPTGTQQFDDVADPSYEFWFAPGSFVYFSVQNQNDSGSVSCTITSNGRTVSQNTSSGAYVIAGCSGRS